MYEEWEALDHNSRVEAWTEQLRELQEEITRLQARQVKLINHLDHFQVDTAQGARTMGEWVASSLDISHQTSNRLWQVARAADARIEQSMAEGRWGLDRAAALVKLRQAGTSDRQFEEAAEDYSLGQLYALVDRLRRISPQEEQDVFEQRYLVIQPSLDDSAYKVWGLLPGVDGRVIDKALTQRESELPVLDGEGQGQRRADALAAICMDSLTGTGGDEEAPRAVTVAEVFVDASLASESGAEAGVTLSTGPRVGPNTLAEILCGGRIRVVVTDGLRPIAYSELGEAIPPVVRSYVMHRDHGQCAIDGCRSRYRLQPHHIRERHHGGSHDPENLVTLCWYHHHVAIHQLGFRIDPDSPVHRRRLIAPNHRGPPAIRERLVILPTSAPVGT
jgi:hypothetical protein